MPATPAQLAVYAHTLRKVADREDAAGRPDLAQDLRAVMTFVEDCAAAMVAPAPPITVPVPAVNADDPIVLHTDGACSGNPGPGGWAVLVGPPENGVSYSGGNPATTNNRMEMAAMVRALEHCVHTPGAYRIRSDSQYVLKGLTEWMRGWKARGWRKGDGKPVENRDLWETLDAALTAAKAVSTVELAYVKGHAGDPGNEACDEIAVASRDRAAASGVAF